VLVLFSGLACGLGRAVTWLPFGPNGGDARSIAADPHDPAHLYLGAANGWVYESRDGGKVWKRLARVGKRDDLVLDNIVVDASNSRHLVVGAWVLGSDDGGLFRSEDGGLSWASDADMRGQSIRALAQAPSDPKIMVAGTLQGVYRTMDGGTHWALISPIGSREIHEVESIAIDPQDPDIIYAGTWHLPWKTVDAGGHWSNIKQGVIEDSDVFSIIVDPKQPKVVFASACSGIYKSEDAGMMFHKVQGIPSTARRTRVLMQDPEHLDTVFAGTTEGLWRSDDAGKTWVRTTGPEVIVNDVYVDPTDSNHVLIATDRGGVLASHDRGNSFDSANNGFSARQITSFLTDARHPSNVYVGVVNDKEWGGVFASENGGLSWVQESGGLGGRDVFSLGQASDGTILAGTGHGIFKLNGAMWSRVGDSGTGVSKAELEEKRTAERLAARRAGSRASKRPGAIEFGSAVTSFDGSVYAMARSGDTMYAATTAGLLESGTAGESWRMVPGMDQHELQFVSTSGPEVVVASLDRVLLSPDGGRRWSPVNLPSGLTQVTGLAVDGFGSVWLGGRDGLYWSSDHGLTWQTLPRVSIRDVNNIYYDAPSERIVVTSGGPSTIVFAVHLPDRTVKFWDTGWNLRFARPVGDHMVGATMFDGVVVQPRMVDSQDVRAYLGGSSAAGKE
jgi:photosystem II stability/assembly factor-like uncharacterized protein